MTYDGKKMIISSNKLTEKELDKFISAYALKCSYEPSVLTLLFIGIGLMFIQFFAGLFLTLLAFVCLFYMYSRKIEFDLNDRELFKYRELLKQIDKFSRAKIRWKVTKILSRKQYEKRTVLTSTYGVTFDNEEVKTIHIGNHEHLIFTPIGVIKITKKFLKHFTFIPYKDIKIKTKTVDLVDNVKYTDEELVHILREGIEKVKFDTPDGIKEGYIEAYICRYSELIIKIKDAEYRLLYTNRFLDE